MIHESKFNIAILTLGVWLKVNISTVHLDNLRIIHDFRCIDIESLAIRKIGAFEYFLNC